MSKTLLFLLLLFAGGLVWLHLFVAVSNRETEEALIQSCWDNNGAYYSNSSDGFICVDKDLKIIDLDRQHSITLERLISE